MCGLAEQSWYHGQVPAGCMFGAARALYSAVLGHYAEELETLECSFGRSSGAICGFLAVCARHGQVRMCLG